MIRRKKTMNLKKAMMSGFAALALIVSGVGAANATQHDYEINLYGASAQKDFWHDAAPAFVQGAPFYCGTPQQHFCDADEKHGVTYATGCEVDGDGLGDDTVTIRYSAKASYAGICAASSENADATCASDCTPAQNGKRMMCDAIGNTTLTCTQITLGASDVEGASFVQATMGAENGHLGGNFVMNSFDGFDTTGLEDAADYGWSVVVPFGFFANNKVTRGTCCQPCPGTYTGMVFPDNAPNLHKAYSRWGDRCWPTDANGVWSDPVNLCDPVSNVCTTGPRINQACTTDQECPTYSHRCIGYYKCVDGTCNGGVRAGQACSKTKECPDVEYGETACVQMPIRNLPRIKVILLFKDLTLTNWQQFGREYANLPITRCMRHAGSGTHATLDLAVMGEGVSPYGFSTGDQAYHYRSSSDLTKCVGAFDGGVGYADADKLLGKGGGDYGKVHYVNYNGHAALRRNVAFCEYTFWSAQHTYWDPAEVTSDVTNQYYYPLHKAFLQYAGNPMNLSPANVGYHSDYWAATSEMGCRKANGRAFPTYQPFANHPFDAPWADANPY